MSKARNGTGSKLRAAHGHHPGVQHRFGSWRRAWMGLGALAVFCAVPGAVAVPLIGANFRISEISTVDLNRDALRSAVAYNSAAMEYLVVWEGDGLADDATTTPPRLNDDVDEIFGRRIDAVSGAVIGGDFRISNTSHGGTGDQSANPAVAYNSTANEYLVVWQGGSANQDEIFAQRLNAAGGELGGDFQVSNASGSADSRDASNPAVAYNDADNAYLVVWQDGAGNDDEILGQQVAADGSLMGSEVAISDMAAGGAGRSAAHPALAYAAAANTYLVVWEGNGLVSDPDAEAIFGQVVLADGTPSSLTDLLIAASRAARPDVAQDNDDGEHLVVFQSETALSSEIFGQRVDMSGSLVGSRFRISDDTQARGPAVAHGSGNNQYLVVWQAEQGALQQEIFGRLVSGPGNRLGAADARISFTIDTAGADRDSALAAVAYDGRENLFLVAYEADGLPDLVAGDDNDDVIEIFGQFAEPFFPDLRLFKDDGGVTAVPGGTIDYMLDFGNIGDGPAPDAVITETVPSHATFNGAASSPGWSCTPDGNPGSTCTIPIGTLSAGDGGSVTFAVTVDAPLPNGVAEIANSATIADDASGGEDANPADNAASDTTPVDAAPDLRIAKDDGGITALPGGTIAYTLSYANVGDQDAVGVVVTETVPSSTTFSAGSSTAGWSCGDGSAAGTSCTLSVGALGAGQGDTAVFAVAVDALVPAGLDAVTNAVSIADDGTNGADPNPTDNTAGDTTPVDATPDLQIAKDDGGVTAGPGATIVYALDFANIGNQGATGTTISETVPANTTFDAGSATAGWSCADGSPAGTLCTLSLGGLAAGDSGSARFAVAVDDPLPAGVGEIANTASIADDGANGPDPNLADNTDSDTTPVGTPDLQVAKDDGGIGAAPGDTVVYTLSYANVGDRDATGTVLTDVVPADTTFDAAAGTPGWSCTPDGAAGAVCTLALGTLAAGDSGSAGFAITIDNPLPDTVVQIANTASIADDGASGPDANPADNTDSDFTPVLTPEEQADALLEFVDDAIAGGTLSGSGPGGSANGRLGALINKIDSARALIEAGDTDGACSELRSALRRTDGLTPPPDFVEGEAADALAAEIRQLQARLGCS